jgi:hypothetical protein
MWFQIIEKLQKKIEIKVNKPFRSKKLEKKRAKKRPNISRLTISNFFAIKIFSKKWYATKIVGGRFGFIDCKKSFAYAFCWKLVVEVF